MILRWLRKKIYQARNPEDILRFCALYGAVDVFGPIGAIVVIIQAVKKGKEQNASTRKKTASK